MESNDKKTLLVIDVQREYNTLGRPFYLKNIEESLNNIKNILNFARKNKWDIIHVKHLQEETIFVKGDEYSDYIFGFEPLSSEKEFIKGNYSCYSNEEFAKYLKIKEKNEIYVVGYGSTMCVLSTIIDGYHRGNNFTFIKDASLAKSEGEKTEKEIHEIMSVVISKYAKVSLSRDVLR